MTHSVSSERSPDLGFLSQHLFTAVLWVDASLRITWINAQAEQLLAISRGRLLQQSILALLAPTLPHEQNGSQETARQQDSSYDQAYFSARFAQAQHYQQPFVDHDHLIQFAGSTPVSVDYSVTPVLYQQQPYFIVEMWGKDRQSRISEEQHKQQQYHVARHMLRSVAHEVKNPLAGIRGAAQLLERQFNKFSASNPSWYPESLTPSQVSSLDPSIRTLAQKLRNYTDIIISETDRLTQLIGQMLGSARLPNWQPLNVHEPLEHVLTLALSQSPHIELHRDYDLSLPELIADKDQLIQVFLNLINNACEAMSEHKQTLATDHSNAQPPSTHTDTHYQPQLCIQTRVAFQHTIGSQQHKQVMQISITDNGAGIAPELIGQIFFPMVTSRAAGTGLGLAIVQDIISRHHGMIDVSSVRGQTRFIVYLPFTQPPTVHTKTQIQT